MQLRDYMATKEVTPAEMARKVGVSVSAISRYCAGERTPEPPILKKIRKATGGMVTPNDFI